MRASLLLFVYLISSFATHAEDLHRLADQRNIIFDRLATEDGLSQGIVTTFAQDDMGFIWIGTQEGLNRFDGFEFQNYYHLDSDEFSLSHNFVWSLLFDSSKNFWIGTDSGLNYFDYESQTFHLVPLEGEVSKGAQPEVFSLLEDSNGDVWVGTSLGLAQVQIDSRGRPALHLVVDTIGSLRALAQADNGDLFIGSEIAGILVLDSEDGTTKALTHDSHGEPIVLDRHVRDLLVDDKSNLWVATFNGGLSKLNLKSMVVTHYTHLPEDKSSLASNRVRSVFQDSSGEIWVGTDNGLHLLVSNKSFLRFQTDLTDPRSISDNSVQDIFQDEGGVVWIGTFNGVSKWNAKVDMFPFFKRSASVEGKIPGDNVTSFVEDKNGNVWIGTLTGLMYWDAQEGELYSYHQDFIALSDKRVMSLGTRGEEIWVGTMAGGVNVIQDKTVVAVYEHEPGRADSLSSNAITRIVTDSLGRTWIATYGGGLNQLIGANTFRRYPAFKSETEQYFDLRAMDLLERPDGKLWLSTDGGGVFLLNPDSGDVISLSNLSKNALSSEKVLSLLDDDQGLWVGSLDKGLNFWNRETREITAYSKEDGLASDSVYGLLRDEDGRLWVSGGKGLTRFDPVNEEFTRFDSSHGLQSSDFNSGAYYKVSDGSLLFGGNNGFNAFFPSNIDLNGHVPDIRLTGFSLFNSKVLSGRKLDGTSVIELRHDDSVIGFSFAALDYTAPEKNQYRYMLEGFDKDWVEHGGNREVTYTNLDAGEYRFRVQGSNNDGVWNEQGASVSILVHPAPWLTWWAYCFYLALVSAAFLLMLRWNSDRMQREAERQYSERLQLYIESLEEASDSILIADSDGILLYANNTIVEGLGKSPDDVVGQSLFDVLFQDSKDVEIARHSLLEDSRYHGEVELSTESGVPVIHEVTIAAVQQSSSGSAYVGISRDVTERKLTEAELEDYRRNLERLVSERTERLQKEIAENKAIQVHLANSLQEKELLIKEVHHRVKNNMQVISSLLSIQAEGAGDEIYSTLLNESQQRIKSMALIHETLYQSDDLLKIDFQEYIESLTNSLSRSYTVPGVSVLVDVNVEDVQLDLETAVPCGLIINELASNALKHAFVGKEGTGVIDIDFVVQDCNYSLRIADNGVGLSEEFDLNQHTSMGMEIVAILTAQLEGDLKACNDEGAVFEITFPRGAHA